uniref:Cadherin domain-containing protein n=1 Tax=Heterorhabditis bacteriophora TaxID=37862 RepID=A0A1I7XRX5_HETBA
MGKKGQPEPTFKIVFDRMKWFELGEIVSREVRTLLCSWFFRIRFLFLLQTENYMEYKLTINQRAEVYVQYSLTKGGTYKFEIEAKQGASTSSAKIRVDVLSLSQNTHGTSRVTDTKTTILPMQLSTSEISSINDVLKTNFSKEMETSTMGSVWETTLKMKTFTIKSKHFVQNADKLHKTDILMNQNEVINEETTPKFPFNLDKENNKLLKSTFTENSTPNQVKVNRPVTESDPSIQSATEKSSEEDDPLINAVTIATAITQNFIDLSEEKEEPTKNITLMQDPPNNVLIVVNGTEDNVFHIKQPLHAGDILQNFTVSIKNEGKIFAKFQGIVSKANVTIRTEMTNNSKHDLDQSKVAKVLMYTFLVSEDAPSGTTIGSIGGGGNKKIIGHPGLFAFIGDDLILSCPDEGSCLDYESQKTHYVLIMNKDGLKLSPIQITINVRDVNDHPPSLYLSDSIIRIYNNALLLPFVIQVRDEDSNTAKNELSIDGSASHFLGLKDISDGLYQVDLIGFAPVGRHHLNIQVTDGLSEYKKIVTVEVQNSHSQAHFRNAKYERTITIDKIHPGNALLQVELEGIPIDEARFVILQGNPGWLTVADYGGRVSITEYLGTPITATYFVHIGAIDRLSNMLLAETQLVITVVDEKNRTKRKTFDKEVYESTFDRENAANFHILLNPVDKVSRDINIESTFALDENGQARKLNKEDVFLSEGKVVFKKNSLANLRVVQVQLVAGSEKATVIAHLVSSSDFIEKKLKHAARPIFPAPWSKKNNLIEVVISEELPQGYVVAVLPALNPIDGSVLESKMSGDMKDFFLLNWETGVISIFNRLDFESLSLANRSFDLILTAGQTGYDTEAILRVTVTDIDDNPPIIEKNARLRELLILENIQPGTPIAHLAFNDADEVTGNDDIFVEISGKDSELYMATIQNNSLTVLVGKNTSLDRETSDRQTLLITLRDASGNEDWIYLQIVILDVNDNVPRFSREEYVVQAVENWPEGIILDRIRAFDADEGDNGRVRYTLGLHNAKHFAIDPVNGQLTISEELIGMARDKLYTLTVIAEDGGTPPLSANASVKIKISEPLTDKESKKGHVQFINPPVDFVLNIKEVKQYLFFGNPLDLSLNFCLQDTPVNEHIYFSKAHLVDFGTEEMLNIKYSIQDISKISNQAFGIDESSGEVYVTQPLDYEKQRHYSRKKINEIIHHKYECMKQRSIS